MSKEYLDSKSLIERVQSLLDAGKPREALDLIERTGSKWPEAMNARGVCMLRLGQIDKALLLFRSLVVEGGSVSLNRDAPTLYKTNFATALLLSQNITGCLSVLEDIRDEQDPAVIKLRAAIGRWKRSMSWWKRLCFTLYGASYGPPVTLGFPPGDLSQGSRMRPAA